LTTRRKTPARSRENIGRRQRAQAVGAGYSWFVRVTKFALPITAVVIVGIVIAKMSQDPQQLQIAELPKQEKTTPGQVDIVEASYSGVDAEGRAYKITANEAHRVMGGDTVIALEKPKADITMEDGTWLSVHAANGLYNNTVGTLKLTGGVEAFHDSGYEFHLQDADVKVKGREARTAKPVSVQGPAGTLEAASMTVTDQGQMIVFGGPAKLVLRGKVQMKKEGPG
jgi:lipopolysaccharide export system protein LptC